MPFIQLIFFLLVLMIFSGGGFLSAIIFPHKAYEIGFLCGFVLIVVLSGAAFLMLKSNDSEESENPEASLNAKLKCWHCGKMTQVVRKVCQHCGHELQ
jgi:hypothetical protein